MVSVVNFSKLGDEFIKNIQYVFLCTIFCLYVFFPLLISEQSLIYFLSSMVSIILLILTAVSSKYIFVFLSIFILFLNGIIFHIGLHWGLGNTGARFEVAGLSPVSESFEYMHVNISYIDIFVVLYLILGLGSLIKIMKVSTFKGPYFFSGLKGFFLVALIFLLISMVVGVKKTIPYYFIEKYLYPIDMDKLSSRNKIVEDEKNNLVISSDNLDYNKVVIIIGESVNKNRMGVYGYNLNTTPFLSDISNESNLFIYNAIAPTNQTRYSVPIALTDAKVSDYEKFFSSTSIVSEFNKYGYKTHWYSSQGRVGKHDNAISSIAKEADVIEMPNLVFMDAKKDGVLLEYLEDVKFNSDSKELFVFHFIGSHFDYSVRYDKSEALIMKPRNNSDKYDNTIHYTDKLISKIYDKFKEDSLLLIYVSDHGEVVREGHGFIKPFKDEYEIPLVAVSSYDNPRLNKMKELSAELAFNMEDFNEFVRIASGMEKFKFDISTNNNIFSIEPDNTYNFDNLSYFKSGDSVLKPLD